MDGVAVGSIITFAGDKGRFGSTAVVTESQLARAGADADFRRYRHASQHFISCAIRLDTPFSILSAYLDEGALFGGGTPGELKQGEQFIVDRLSAVVGNELGEAR